MWRPHPQWNALSWCRHGEWPLPDARRPEYWTTHTRGSGAEPASELEARPEVVRSHGQA